MKTVEEVKLDSNQLKSAKAFIRKMLISLRLIGRIIHVQIEMLKPFQVSYVGRLYLMK